MDVPDFEEEGYLVNYFIPGNSETDSSQKSDSFALQKK